MKTAILWSGLAASIYAQTPSVDEPTTTELILGPTNFCLFLSPGGGNECMTISAGCHATMPDYNYFPATTCTSTSSFSASKTPPNLPSTKTSATFDSIVPQESSKTSSTYEPSIAPQDTSKTTASQSSSSSQTPTSSSSSSTQSSSSSQSPDPASTTTSTSAKPSTKSSEPNSSTKTDGPSTTGPSTTGPSTIGGSPNPGQPPDGKPTSTKSPGTQPTGTEAVDDATSKTDKAKDSNDSYQKDPTNKSLAEEVEKALKDALDSAKDAVEQAIDDAVKIASGSLVDALTSALTTATTAASGPTIAAAEALAATMIAVEAAKQVLNTAKNNKPNKPTKRPTKRPSKTKSVTKTSSDTTSRTNSMTTTSKPTSSQSKSSSSSSSSSSSQCPACFSCAEAAMPTPRGNAIDDIAKRAKAPFGKLHEARAVTNRDMQICGFWYSSPNYHSFSGTKDYAAAKFYRLQWEPKKPGPNCDTYGWTLQAEDTAHVGGNYVTEHVYELQLIGQFIKSVEDARGITCKQFKTYFEGGTLWTSTKFGAGGSLNTPGSRPIDELLASLPGDAHPDFAYLDAKLNGIKKNIFTGTQSGRNDWAKNMVLVAQTQTTFEFLEEVSSIWVTTNKRIIAFFEKLDVAAAAPKGTSANMRIGWGDRYKAWISTKLGTGLDNQWAAWKNKELSNIQTWIKNDLGANSALAQKLVDKIQTLKDTGRLEDVNFWLSDAYSA